MKSIAICNCIVAVCCCFLHKPCCWNNSNPEIVLREPGGKKQSAYPPWKEKVVLLDFLGQAGAGPCRRANKTSCYYLSQTKSKKDLKFNSISIDDDKADWRSAIAADNK